MPRVESFERTEVIQKAMKVFWEKGYHGTSIQDLVDATGLNRSSIYNSFGSKHSLYKTTLEQYELENEKDFRQILLKANCPLGAIGKMLENSLEHAITDGEGKGCYIMSCKSEMGHTDKALHKWLLRNQESTISLFRELIEQGQKEGVINSKQDSESYAYFLFNSFQGLRMTGILTKEADVLEQIIKNTITVLE